jgi:hypothetical protein
LPRKKIPGIKTTGIIFAGWKRPGQDHIEKGRKSPMEELIRSIFEAFPEKSGLTLNGKCSDCDAAISIDIIPTSEGFGLLGGAFVECDIEKYVFKCPECYKVNAKIVELYDTKANHLTIFDKKKILSLI